MSKEGMQRGAHIVVVVLEVPGGHGPPSLSPCSDSEVRVLLFNATGDRDTAALLKLLVVRFGGHGGITVPGCLGSLSVCPSCYPRVFPTSAAPCKALTVRGAGKGLGSSPAHPL